MKIVLSIGFLLVLFVGMIIPSFAQVSDSFQVSIDKTEYLPGSYVKISASSENIAPLEGMKYSITDPNGKIIEKGILFPINNNFSTSIFITNVNPIFGTYVLNADYLEVNKSLEFEIIDNVPDSDFENTEKTLFFDTDKLIYDFNLDDKIKIFGTVSQLAQRTSLESPPVEIVLKDSTGKIVTMIGQSQTSKSLSGPTLDVPLVYYSTPDENGNFSLDITVNDIFFNDSKYLLEATYDGIKFTQEIQLIKSALLTSLQIENNVIGLGEIITVFGKIPSSECCVSITITKPDGTTERTGAKLENQILNWNWVAPKLPNNSVVNYSENAKINTNYGIYKITISTDSTSENFFFKVSDNPKNDILYDSVLNVNLEKNKLLPGDKLKISGIVVFSENSISKSIPEVVISNVVSTNNPQKVLLQSTVFPNLSGFYYTSFSLPKTIFSYGDYEVRSYYNDNYVSIPFTLVSEHDNKTDNIPNDDVKVHIPEILFEKQNRIIENSIGIKLDRKINDESISLPRVLSGSLISVPGDESIVNLKVSNELGQCIIGQDDDCLVSESTRKPGQIFDTVFVNGDNFKVRYSGTDARLEKFNILPENDDSFLPLENWTLEVIKENQASKLYYKVTYKIQQ